MESMSMMREKMKKLIKTQFYILLGGTIFAWTIFGMEFYSWLTNQECIAGCSAVPNEAVKFPFYTPCPYGAIFFTIAFVLSAIMLKKVSSCKCEGGKCEE